jgi:hypothetical protein
MMSAISKEAALKEAAESFAKAALENSSPPELKQIAASTQSTADRLQSMEAKLERLAVTQSLQWAIQHCLSGQSKGFIHSSGSSSNEIVADIFFSFNEGLGAWICNQSYIRSNDEKGRQAYRDALSKQIHQLTGVKPRIAKEKKSEGKDQWAIYRV